MAALGIPIEWEYGQPWQAWVPLFFYVLLLNALPEEYGWRGFALDRLQKKSSALSASLILGLIWALWHLPLFFIEGTTQAAIPMVQYMLQTVVLSIFYTWLYNNTGGSVLIAAPGLPCSLTTTPRLFHASANSYTWAKVG